jgi:hypothetical protein
VSRMRGNVTLRLIDLLTEAWRNSLAIVRIDRNDELYVRPHLTADRPTRILSSLASV